MMKTIIGAYQIWITKWLEDIHHTYYIIYEKCIASFR